MGCIVIQIANRQKATTRVLFWGMDGDFSRQVLENLIEEGVRPIGIVLPDFQEKGNPDPIVQVVPESPISPLPLKNPFMHNSIFQAAWEHQVPLFKIRNLTAPRTLQLLGETQPTVAVVACFPKRIPQIMLDLPSAGFLNLHPSLLPSLRGPYPMFWTFRLDIQPGITVHFMDVGLDTGEIVLQNTIEFPDGISGAEADATMARQGASLLVKACRQLANGTMVRTPQQGVSSNYPRPIPENFSIPSSWTARRAFNFICGTAEWDQSFLIHGPDFNIRVRSAVAYNPEITLAQSLQRDGADAWIRFANGTLHARQ